MPISEARKRANAKHDKENFEVVSFKARKGSRTRIAEAALATGKSINGFIRDALAIAVEIAINKPMEDKEMSRQTNAMKPIVEPELYCAEKSIEYKG